jgi:nucleoid DNA-binding protein
MVGSTGRLIEKRESAARTGRNLQMGESMNLPAWKKLTFSQALQVKAMLN